VSDLLVDGDLVLRRAVPADAADIAAVYSEADIQHWMLWEAEEFDEAEALANIGRSEEAWEEGSNAPFRIVADDHVVGGVNLSFRGFDVAEVAYFLRASARGRGLATRAVLLSVDWGFRERRLARIQLRADPLNARASPSRAPNAAPRPTPTAGASTRSSTRCCPRSGSWSGRPPWPTPSSSPTPR